MKFSSISTILTVLALSGTLAVAQSPKTADHPTTATKSEKIQQRFNPIFGSEREANDLLSFISANMVLELDADQVKNIDGISIISFDLDTLGQINRLMVTKSLRPWIDYAIVGGLKRMPHYGKPSTRNNGKVYESHHSIVFSFGSYIRIGEHKYGFQGDAVRANTQKEIDRQRDEHYAKLREHSDKWNKFTTKNSKLEYDTKSGLRDQAGTLSPSDQLDQPSEFPPKTPTIKITSKEL